MVYVLFVLGFVLLIYGADWLVDGSSAVAKRFNISNLVIGLTVVSFGTSAPELAVNIIASVGGNNDLAIGNIVGSNIANVFLILGVSALIAPLAVKSNTVWKEIPISLFAALLLGFVVNDRIFDMAETDSISRIDGIVFLLCFLCFMFYAFWVSRQGNDDDGEQIKSLPVWKSSLLITGGLIGLVLGGHWIVQGAVHIAEIAGLSKAVIGLTVVAIGTSLPELAASAVAVYKGNSDLAIGNVIGSNIFNVFWILGISSTISPMTYQGGENVSVVLNVIASLLLFVFLFVGKRHKLQTWQGAIFVVIYFSYLAYLVWGETWLNF